MYHAWEKHIEIQHHFVRHKIESIEIKLIYYNLEDLLLGGCVLVYIWWLSGLRSTILEGCSNSICEST